MTDSEHKFVEIVVMEIRLRSMMTYSLTKKQHDKFQRFFLRKAKRFTPWDKWQRRNEFDRFCRAFNVKLRK